MSFFNSTEPILRRKQQALDYQDIKGLLQIDWKISNRRLFSGFYTRIDQAFVLWGLISAVIFLTAQFAPISWITQAIFWTILTVLGTIAMMGLTQFWVRVERLEWVLYCWGFLMILGVVITDCGIFLGWSSVLLHLSHLWLGLSGLGYLCTALGLRSRAFLLSGIFHLLGIAVLPYVMGWQFLTTGLLIVVNLFLLAETQWDMCPPIHNYALLTVEQCEFNQQQHRLRQLEH
ncbi:hypothetical protein [Gloeothece verrucosa]|uniref:Uncharacterized protein n=1 Tax=Gloeothece verrucosa (strain PCC 7822) TaxID=497965 RepID=E0UAU4_GLOV7|nr:hypothetical protein [Gloeothece verrucosa]ADN15066.1 conserved hypothetical protein [Gloeothece verrucosa PCC 7822]